MQFNEDSRVKIPTIIHLTRLGYNYLSLNDAKCDEKTNIFDDIFIESIIKINEGIENKDAQRLMEDIKLTLENEDLGKAFYEKLIATSGLKLIDFVDFNKNRFDVVTELTYKNGDEAAPEIRAIERKNSISFNKKIPIIALIGDSSSNVIYEYFKAEINDNFVKGISANIVARKLLDYIKATYKNINSEIIRVSDFLHDDLVKELEKYKIGYDHKIRLI